MFKQGPRSGQDNYRLISVFILVGFPLYLTIDILPNKAKYHLETVLLGNHACYIYFLILEKNIKSFKKICNGSNNNNNDDDKEEDQEKANEYQEQQKWIDIKKEEAALSIMKSSNSKAPVNVGTANLWIKNLTCIHDELTIAYKDILKHPEKAPDWLTDALTYLLPRTQETKNARNYQLIICLPTMYKILISILTDRTYVILEENELLPSEQKRCKRGSYGRKDQLLINKMILENCKRNERNLPLAWVDYKKAFNSVHLS